MDIIWGGSGTRSAANRPLMALQRSSNSLSTLTSVSGLVDSSTNDLIKSPSRNSLSFESCTDLVSIGSFSSNRRCEVCWKWKTNSNWLKLLESQKYLLQIFKQCFTHQLLQRPIQFIIGTSGYLFHPDCEVFLWAIISTILHFIFKVK